MLASSAFVLAALTMTGVYMKGQNVESRDDGYTLDFTALPNNADDKLQEITENNDEHLLKEDENIPGLTANNTAGNEIAGAPVTEDDLDYMPQEVGSGNVEIPGLTDQETLLEAAQKEQQNSDADRQKEERKQTAGGDVVVEKTLHFAESDGLQQPVQSDILMHYSMDKSTYFATLDQYKYNPATIFSAEEGTAVTACAQGKVTSIFENEEIGKAVTLDLGDGYEATYGQLTEITVKENSYVNPGDTTHERLQHRRKQRILCSDPQRGTGERGGIVPLMYIVGGRILTMAGREIPEGILQIRNGKIAQVGARGEVKLQPEEGEQVVIAKNALIMPGIIEAHCHMGIMEEKKSTEGDDCNETVDPLTPSLRAIDGINPMDAAFDDAVRAGITAAMIGPGSSNVVGGQFAMVKTKGRRIDDLILKSPAAMKVAFGENPKVNYSGQNKSPVTRMAIAAMLRREFWESREYLRQKQEAAEKGEYFAPDFEKECYLPVLRGDIPLKAHVHRVDDIFTAIRIAKEFGIKMTMDHCSEGHLVAEELAKEGFPAIVGPDLTSRNKIEVQNMSFKTAGVLNRAGVMVAITTDHPVSQIQTLPLCAGLAVKAGLPMEEGFRAITIYPAKICGVADRIGSLEVGKDADIAIFDGNPMEIFTRTLYTIINGEIVYCNVPRE